MTNQMILEDAKLMKTIIDPLIPVGQDLYIEISKNGFRAHIKSMHNAWAADAMISGSNFKTIDIEGAQEYHVDLKNFADFIKTVQNDESLTIRETEGKDELELVLESDEMIKKLVLRLNSPPDQYKIMEFMKARSRLSSHSTIQVDLFAQAIKAAELGGDEVKITHTPKKLHLLSENKNTTQKSEAEISYSSGRVTDILFQDGIEFCEATYKLEYLKHISRIGKSDDKLNLYMEVNNGPIVLTYVFKENDEEEEIGYIGFAVAPRVKDDEDEA